MEYSVNGGPGSPATQATVAGSGDHTLADPRRRRRRQHVRRRVDPSGSTGRPGQRDAASGRRAAHQRVHAWPSPAADTLSGVAQRRVAGRRRHAAHRGLGHHQATDQRPMACTRSRPAWSTASATPRRGAPTPSTSTCSPTTSPRRPTSRPPPPPAGRPAPIPVEVAATDDGSGVATVQWRIDGQPLKTAPGDDPSFDIEGEGTHRLETSATDRKGNRSSFRSQIFKIDLSVPDRHDRDLQGLADRRAASR